MFMFNQYLVLIHKKMVFAVKQKTLIFYHLLYIFLQKKTKKNILPKYIFPLKTEKIATRYIIAEGLFADNKKL
jgi:hypothetical protein